MKTIHLAVAAMMATVAIQPAEAALLTYTFAGTVNSDHSTDPLLGMDFSFGQSVSGSLTVDDSLPDVDGSVNGYFEGALTSISLTAGLYSASATGGAVLVDPFNNISGVYANISGGAFAGNATVVGADVAGLELGSIELTTSQDIFDDSFPSILFPLADLPSLQGFLVFQDEFEELYFTGFSISSLSLEIAEQGVPAPGALALLGFGLLGFRMRRRTM